MIDRLKAALSIPVYNDDDGFCWCAVEAEEIRKTIQRLEQVEVMREALEIAGRFIGNQTSTKRGTQVYNKIHNALNQTKLP